MKLTLRYSITHFTHWAAGTAAVSFATFYLMNRGVSAGMAGTLLALSGLLSCISQPFLAAAADRAKKNGYCKYVDWNVSNLLSVFCAAADSGTSGSGCRDFLHDWNLEFGCDGAYFKCA